MVMKHITKYLSRPKGDVLRLEIGLTSTCNLECPLCIRQTHSDYVDNSIKYRSYEEITNQIDEYPNLEFITIAGSISEPTLHPRLYDIIRYLISRDIEISLYINGDTYKDNYYRKLGVIFRNAKGKIFLTICGSTQELHEKYRVKSKLDRVINRLDILLKYTDAVVLTWLVFNYNQDDYNQNRHKFEKYDLEVINTLPIQEHYEIESEIHLVNNLHDIYNELIDKKDFENIKCPSLEYGFELVNYKGETSPCVLYDMYGDKHCWECSAGNSKVLKDNKIYKVAEAEDEYSETELRIYDN
jgi:sulfatase maturation enzyme AslB (radical SAM superfamily)